VAALVAISASEKALENEMVSRAALAKSASGIAAS